VSVEHSWPGEAIPAELGYEVWGALRGSPAFEAASDEALRRLGGSSHFHELERGEVLFPSDVRCEPTLVVAGTLHAVHTTPEGRRVVVRLAQRGELMCLMHSLAGSPSGADIEAVEPTAALVIPASAIESLLVEEPSAAVSLLRDSARCYVEVTGHFEAMPRDLQSRLARFVVQRVRQGEVPEELPLKVDLQLSRVEIAGMLMTTPESLSRAFHSLQDSGVISSEGGPNVWVLDVRRLKDIAEGR
jgi:CRP-like cAMP-binding protein